MLPPPSVHTEISQFSKSSPAKIPDCLYKVVQILPVQSHLTCLKLGVLMAEAGIVIKQAYNVAKDKDHQVSGTQSGEVHLSHCCHY